MEEWKGVLGYEGSYEVSNEGRVRSLERIVNPTRPYMRKGGLLKPNTDRDGYQRVTLFSNGARKKVGVHQLVARTFIPNLENFPIINHKDENPRNNRVENLEWCTHEYNSNYGNRNHKVSKEVSKAVTSYNPLSKEFKHYSSMELTREDGFTPSKVSRCCNGKQRTHRGLLWEFQ